MVIDPNELVAATNAQPETTTETAVETLPPGVSKILTLPSGAVATIYKGKGKHARQAQKLMGDDSSLYMPALMAQLVQINGKYLLMEEYDEVDLDDYNELQLALGGNFTKSVPAT